MSECDGDWEFVRTPPWDDPELIPVLNQLRRFRYRMAELDTDNASLKIRRLRAEARQHVLALSRHLRPLTQAGHTRLEPQELSLVKYHFAEADRLMSECLALLS